MSSEYFVQTEFLTKVYPSGKKGKEDLVVFNDVTLGLKKGEFVSCIGHSGCGKSTILNILAGLDSATQGIALMGGKETCTVLGAVLFPPNQKLMPLVHLRLCVNGCGIEWKIFVCVSMLS